MLLGEKIHEMMEKVGEKICELMGNVDEKSNEEEEETNDGRKDFV